MNKKELIKKLNSDIQDIYSITNKFENSENIHPLDIDLALSKVRNLYELLLKLDVQGIQITENQKEEISTPVKKEEQKEESEITKEVKAKPKEADTTSEKKEEITEEKTSANKPEFIIETGSEEKKVEEIIEEKIETKQSNNPEIVADKFQSKKFVHDNISKKNVKKDVSAKMQSKPIQDINSAIGLNDRFIFIRELFGNNKEHYHETVQVLNNFDTYNNAVKFLDENFDWEPENENYERLKELVRRKFATK